jgi:putative transposase
MLIKALAKEHNISISALCKTFGMARSSFYHKGVVRQEDNNLVALVKDIFKDNYKSYGTRRIKEELSKVERRVSRPRIARIMAQEGLVSNYTRTKFKPANTDSTECEHINIVNQEFDNSDEREVIVTDTTYVWIDDKWHYLCVMLDLCGRHLSGYAVDSSKDATLAQRALLSMKCDYRDIGILHSDKGSEFVNKLIDKTLRAFDILRSTSGKGNVFDNSVAESMFKTIKTESLKNKVFHSLEEFDQYFAKWVDWYNNKRIHSSLGYLTPEEFRKQRREEINNNYYVENKAI